MNNLKKIIAEFNSFKLDGLLVTSEVNRFYASNHPTSEGTAVLTGEKSYYLTDSRYIEAARAAMPDFEVIQAETGKVMGLINGILADHKISRVGIEEEKLTLREFREYERELKAKLVDCSKLYAKLRAVKEPWEMEVMRRAQAIADKTFAELLGIIRPGMTEQELGAEVIYRLMKNGGEGISFDPIVVSGPNTSKPHGIPGSRKLENGDFITMDFGCKFGGYCSDMTRTVALGSATDEMRKVYDIVAEAQLAGIAAAKAGVTGADIDAAAREVIKNAGYGEYFQHSFGHSLGIEIHEPPNASFLNKEPMPEGAVISAEPGIYIAGKFGVRIEDVIILGRDGNENITFSPKEFIIV